MKRLGPNVFFYHVYRKKKPERHNNLKKQHDKMHTFVNCESYYYTLCRPNIYQ